MKYTRDIIMSPSQKVLDWLVDTVKDSHPHLAVDLGTGAGTSAETISRGSNLTITIENDKKFLLPENTDKVISIYAPLRPIDKGRLWYDKFVLSSFFKGLAKKIDFLWIDGPMRKYGREEALVFLKEYLQDGAQVFLHDAQTEFRVAQEWQHQHQGQVIDLKVIRIGREDEGVVSFKFKNKVN